MIEKTPFFSWKCGELCDGCKMCVKGQKLVLFVTGICSRNCFYCPLSDTKKGLDVIYADEWKLKDENDTEAIVEEARLIDAKGAGITGGDPLLKTERVARYIKLLKENFGKNFHMHLYTLPESITEERLEMLHKAGLDEIRLHPDFKNDRDWGKIGIVKKFSWKIGVEIPAIHNLEKETCKMIDFFKDKIDFLNINELEMSDSKASRLAELGYSTKSDLSYGIKGSEEFAFKLMERYGNNLNIHYCTTKLKDGVQLAERIKRRANNVKADFDKMTEEGLLIRGAIYFEEIYPGFGYRKKLAEISENEEKKAFIIKKLKQLKDEVQKSLRIPNNLIKIDNNKLRILTSESIARKIASIAPSEKLNKQQGLPIKVAVVTEYPTWDQTEVEMEFLC
ncbi:MAG: radical SAM protein [Candidatus Woesearchaeota archaeon]|nr:radical SAM protein [Candidatus Woesearchaeota archaeon]